MVWVYTTTTTTTPCAACLTTDNCLTLPRHRGRLPGAAALFCSPEHTSPYHNSPTLALCYPPGPSHGLFAHTCLRYRSSASAGGSSPPHGYLHLLQPTPRADVYGCYARVPPPPQGCWTCIFLVDARASHGDFISRRVLSPWTFAGRTTGIASAPA